MAFKLKHYSDEEIDEVFPSTNFPTTAAQADESSACLVANSGDGEGMNAIHHDEQSPSPDLPLEIVEIELIHPEDFDWPLSPGKAINPNDIEISFPREDRLIGEIEPIGPAKPPRKRFEFDKKLPRIVGTCDEIGTPVAFVTGLAGAGKTTIIMQELLDDPNFAVLSSTTGISAVNLGAITINSLLGYADIESLKENVSAGFVRYKLAELKSSGIEWLIIDECSMLPKQALDYIMIAIRQFNESQPDNQPLGLMLVGDLAQLPPVPGVLISNGKPVIVNGREKREQTPWIFDSEEWPEFEKNMTKLDKVWRQSNPDFLLGINAIRSGKGNSGATMLKRAGVEFRKSLAFDFDGTTIVAKNDEVDRMNSIRLADLPGKTITIPSERWHARKYPPSDWKHVPEVLRLKEGAYVTVLVNNPPDFTYVNGDCGHVRGFSYEDGKVTGVSVELIRTKELITLGYHTRYIDQKAEPDEKHEKIYQRRIGMSKRWVLGELKFLPLRLAWATTVHKSQGLSLDRVQLNPNSHFFGSNNMCYVGVSRARTPEGLIIVGDVKVLADKVKTDPKIRRFI